MANEFPLPLPVRAIAALGFLVAGLLAQRRRRQHAEEALRRSEERYRTVIDTQSELICRFLPDSTLTFVNDACCRFWNKGADDLLGTRFLDLIPQDARERVRAQIASLVDRPRTEAHEHEVVLPGGGIGWQHWINHAIPGADGRVTELQGVGHDVTDRKRATDALRQSEAHNVAMLRALPDLVFVFSKQGVYLDYHGRNRESLFVPPERFLGKNMCDVLPPELAARFLEAFSRVEDSAEPLVVEYSLPISDEIRFYEARLVAAESDRILSIVRDVTERHRASDRNHELAGRLIASQEAERQRVARELHDDLSQKLALLNVDLEMAVQMGERPVSLGKAIRDAATRAAEIASDIHRLSHDLHPAWLQTLGLVAALEGVCRDVSRQHGIDVQFAHIGWPAVVMPEISLCLYRVTQEALHNVVKHSGSRRASVRLVREDDDVILQIADQGAGFVPNLDDLVGLGLISMRERVNFVGGRLAIHSSPELGTRIDARVPLSGAPRRGAGASPELMSA